MINLQIVKILRSFTKEEINSFTDFIYSPYYNKSKTVQKLWDEVKKYAPEFDSPNLEKEKVFKKIFGDKNFNYGTMKNLISTFTSIAEKFLELKYYESEKFQCDYNSLASMIIKYLPESFNKKYKKVYTDYEDTKEGDDFHFLNKYMLMRLHTSLSGLQSKMDYTIFREGEALISFFFVHLFQVHHNIISFLFTKGATEENNLVEKFIGSLNMEKILDDIKAVQPKHYEVINLYYHINLCRKNPDNDKHFFEFKKLMLNGPRVLGKNDFKNLTDCYFNVLSERSLRGIQGTKKETAEFVKFCINEKVEWGNTEKHLAINTFASIISKLLIANDFENAELCYKKYSKMILKEDKKNIENLYNAFYSYSEKKFDKALEYASKIRSETPMIKFYVKGLETKSHYEVSPSDIFSYSINAYRQMIYRFEAVEERKDFAKNYLNAMSALYEYREFGRGNLDDIKFEVMKNKMLSKEWILEKIEELEEKNNK